MIEAKEAFRRIVRRCGYRITRWQPGVRGQAMEEALAVMKSMGFHPNVVIDGGANFGQWARSIHPLFPNARWHLIEPQPTCHPELARFAAKHRDMALHRSHLLSPASGKFLSRALAQMADLQERTYLTRSSRWKLRARSGVPPRASMIYSVRLFRPLIAAC